jgi:hypothetical protein
MPSPPNITNIPAPRVPIIDERTGLISREWYRFFFNLFNLTGGGSNATSLQDLQVGPPGGLDEQTAINQRLDGLFAGPDGSTQESQIAALQTQVEALTLNPPFAGDPPAWALPPRAVAVGASPFTIQNTTGQLVDLIVTGGTVSAIDFSRDNVTFYGVGQTAGVFCLSPYDYLRVTYIAAPTITLVPR